MHSPIKAAGGKARLVPDLISLIPPHVGQRSDRCYYEPFFGGGALFWALVVCSFVGWLLWTWVNSVRGVARSAPFMYLMPPVAGVIPSSSSSEPS